MQSIPPIGIPRHDLGQPGGPASLDAGGTIPLDQLNRPWFDIRSYGATTEAADNSAEIQAAIDAAAAVDGGIVFVPPGTWTTTSSVAIKSGVRLMGVGDASVISNATSDLVEIGDGTNYANRWGVEHLSLISESGGGHVFVNASGGSQCWITHMWAQQKNAGKSIFRAHASEAANGFFDMRVMGVTWIHTTSATVPAVDINGNNYFNANQFYASRFWNSGVVFVKLVSEGTTPNRSNAFRDINFEVCNGGCIYLAGARSNTLDNCSSSDTTTMTGHRWELDGSGPSLSYNNVFRRCDRYGGTLPGGLYDIKFTGNTRDNMLEDCQGTATDLKHELNSLFFVWIGNPNTATLENADRGVIYSARYVRMPRYDEAFLPTGEAGMVVYNNDNGQLVVHDGSNWTTPDGTAL